MLLQLGPRFAPGANCWCLARKPIPRTERKTGRVCPGHLP